MAYEHQLDRFEPLEVDEVTAHCVCGWSFGPCPGTDYAIDVLMRHATDSERLRMMALDPKFLERVRASREFYEKHGLA